MNSLYRWMVLVSYTIEKLVLYVIREEMIGSIATIGTLVCDNSKVVQQPMGCGQKLCRFEDHLHNMLVVVIGRAANWVAIQIEDVHQTIPIIRTQNKCWMAG